MIKKIDMISIVPLSVLFTCNLDLKSDDGEYGEYGDFGDDYNDLDERNDVNEGHYEGEDYKDYCEEVLEILFSHVTERCGMYEWRGWFGIDEERTHRCRRYGGSKW